MKINNKKVIISTLALAMGAALAGSISGSVAWYQYSTRATASISGTSAGTSRNLQIKSNKAGAAWGWDVSAADIKSISGNDANGNLKPVAAAINDSTGAIDGFYSHPIRQYGFGAAERSDYLQFSLSFKSVKEGNALEAVPVYLEKLNINFENESLKNALRIMVDNGSTKTILSNGNKTTTTHGNIDLNHDGVNDRNVFEGYDGAGLINDGGTLKLLVSKTAVASGSGEDLIADSSVSGWFTDAACTAAATSIVAGTTYYKIGEAPATDGTPVAGGTSFDGKYIDYKTEASGDNTYSSVDWAGKVATFSDAYTVSGTALGNTTTDVDNPLTLTFTIWLEGWAEIGTTPSNIWDSTLIGTDYSIQMRFQTPAAK